MYMFVDAEWIKQQFRMKLKSRSCWQMMQELPWLWQLGCDHCLPAFRIRNKTVLFSLQSFNLQDDFPYLPKTLVSSFGCINGQDWKIWSTAKNPLAQKTESSCYVYLLNSHRTTTTAIIFLTTT